MVKAGDKIVGSIQDVSLEDWESFSERQKEDADGKMVWDGIREIKLIIDENGYIPFGLLSIDYIEYTVIGVEPNGYFVHRIRVKQKVRG
uniref:Uncharacterized protein n=1 Tax=viral metagenome TaxID=1070528 RepID=A0A6M3JUQ4_9ZZZZ